VGASIVTSLAVQAITPTQAVPALVIYKERPALMQVDPKQVARELLHRRDFRCFTKLMGKESAWLDKDNPTSTASGVGQLLKGTYENLGMRKGESRVSQTVAALSYISRKYGSGGPCKAWSFFKQNNYY
jgi:hypothetical protein